MPCLDTNFIIAVLKADPDATGKMAVLEGTGERMTTTSINIFELYKGAYQSARPEKAEQIADFLTNIDVLDLTAQASKTAAGIVQELRSCGQTISEMDALIAGAAIANNQTIVTRDEHLQRIKQLRVETW
jgi:tRNA(fMet)-specific endonuclease VapC